MIRRAAAFVAGIALAVCVTIQAGSLKAISPLVGSAYNPSSVAITGGTANGVTITNSTISGAAGSFTNVTNTGQASQSATITPSGSGNIPQLNAFAYQLQSINTGTWSGTGNLAWNYTGIADTAACASGAECYGYFLNQSLGGNYTGNRIGIGCNLAIPSAPGAGDTSQQLFVCLSSRVIISSNLGGSIGSYTSGRGSAWGLNTNTQLTSAATGIQQAFGYEADINNQGTVNQKYGVAAIYGTLDTVAAVYDDDGFLVTGSGSGPNVSPNIMYAIGTLGSTFPGTSTSTILGVVSQIYPNASVSHPSFKYGVDLNPSGTTVITPGGFAFRSPGFTVDPTGNVVGLGYTGSAGASINGAAINLNASSNFATNIGTGSTTQNVTLGGGSNKVVVGSPLVIPAGTACSAAALQYSGNAATGLVFPNANQVGICANTSENLVVTGGGVSMTGVINVNGGAVNAALVGTTGSIGGGALLAGACTSGTVAVTGATTAMGVNATPVAYPGDGTDWKGYVSSAGTVTVKVCGLVAVTPTATTYNVRVIQ